MNLRRRLTNPIVVTALLEFVIIAVIVFLVINGN